MSSIASLSKRIEKLATQVPAPDRLRECDKWPPALSWFTDDEQEHVRDLIARVAPRMKWHDDGQMDFEQITENELNELAEVQEKVRDRSGGK